MRDKDCGFGGCSTLMAYYEITVSNFGAWFVFQYLIPSDSLADIPSLSPPPLAIPVLVMVLSRMVFSLMVSVLVSVLGVGFVGHRRHPYHPLVPVVSSLS
jgi:hypothetical protein